MVLFCPSEELARNSGATPAFCVTNVGGDGKAVLSIENHTFQPVTLKLEGVLGTLEPIQLITTTSMVNALKTTKEIQKST